MPEKNWEVAYYTSTAARGKLAGNFLCTMSPPDTSGFRSRKAVWESRNACNLCVLLQKAGPVKVTNAPSLCTHTSAEAQKTQQTVDMLGEPASKVYLALMSVMKMILME